MSGGHFNYEQYRINDIATEIERLIKDNKILDEYGYCYNYDDSIINEFKIAVQILKVAEVYAQRIDWLVSGDDGEDSFHRRLSDDLMELKNETL